jgi:hypothetical protein
MLTTVRQLKTNGALRKDVDLEALVWAIDCLNIGYLFLRSIHAADRKWDDAKELEKMADILLRGSAAAPSRSAARRQSTAARSKRAPFLQRRQVRRCTTQN